MEAGEKFEYWVDAAEYDLVTAEAMYNTGRWLYVVFMCQQAVEKLVKGLYTLYVDDNVPRSHNISNIIYKFSDRLAEEIPEDTLMLFERLTAYYLDGRYPSFKSKLNEALDKETATKILTETKEVYKWLLTLKP